MPPLAFFLEEKPLRAEKCLRKVKSTMKATTSELKTGFVKAE